MLKSLLALLLFFSTVLLTLLSFYSIELLLAFFEIFTLEHMSRCPPYQQTKCKISLSSICCKDFSTLLYHIYFFLSHVSYRKRSEHMSSSLDAQRDHCKISLNFLPYLRRSRFLLRKIVQYLHRGRIFTEKKLCNIYTGAEFH